MANFTRVLFSFYFIAVFYCGYSQVNTGSPAIPFGSKIAANANPYSYGIVPTNLPTGAYTPASNLYGKSQDAYNAYNTWKSNYVVACGSQYRVLFDDGSSTVSEGIGYGMLLAAYAGDKTLFDGLWAYYKANSDGNGLMNWKIGGCSGASGTNGASDADEDAAMALTVAACQWPSATSPYTYKTEATNLITAINKCEVDTKTSPAYQMSNGDGWINCNSSGNTCRNPSYQAPAYYKYFSSYVPSLSSQWTNSVNAAYTLINANRNSTTGLVSDWCDQNGNTNSCNGSSPGTFGYDACRSPWRMAVDMVWNNDANASAICAKIASYVNGVGASSIAGPVAQSGGTGSNHNATFVAMFAAGVVGSTNQTLMNSMYTQTVNTTDALPAYFGNTLRVVSLFLQTGNFWQPCNVASSGVTVSLTSPTSGQTFNEGAAITLTANASTSSGTITKVEFYNGSTLIGTATSSPYTITWSGAASGSAQITAIAYNSSSQTATSSIVPITIYKAVNQTGTPPVIDGLVDAMWGSPNTQANLKNVIVGSLTGQTADLAANYRAMWDNTNFYLIVNVTDGIKINNNQANIYDDDGIEVYFDIGNLKPTTYTSKDFQYAFRWNDPKVYELHSNATTGVTFAQTNTSTGYIMEISFPWSTLTGSPAVNQLVGFDVMVNDDDDGTRDAKISWNATADQAWTNPSYEGTVVLKGIACTGPSAAGSITGLTAVCSGQTGVTYSIASVTGATSYNWTLPSGATITSGSGTNSITATFASTGGAVSVTPTNTCGNGNASTVTISITPAVTPSVTASSSSTTVCSGTNVTFTASPTNGGTAPTYQWSKNGTAISGATSANYSTSTIANNDKFTVVLTSNMNCATPATATSGQVTMTVTPTATPSVTASSSSTTVCSGTNVTFTASPTNGGTAPTYQWSKNGTAISGATSATYSTSTIANNDNFTVVLTSNMNCATPATATSAQVTMTVTPTVAPTVTASTNQTSICSGTNVTFTASPTNGGTAPTYQWSKNGTAISGATSANYSTSTIANNDNFTVVLTSNMNCATPATATSAQVTMTVTPTVAPTVTVSTNQTSICSGTNVTFTASPTNGGTAPTYQWSKNGTAISGATSATYSTAAIANNDKFTVVLTSNANCASPTTATSAQVTMTVTPTVAPTVTASTNQTSICSGTNVTFTASPTNGGTSPTYQWSKNGSAISGAASATYSTSAIANNDKFTVVLTSNANCASPATATSGQVTMTVTPTVTPIVTASASQTSICSGTSVTFTASPTNGGTTPTYQWSKNGTAISGATSATYATSTIANNDKFSVVLTSNQACVSTNTANSNQIAISIVSNVNVTVSISASPAGAIYAGQSVTFTANPSNGGSAPTYQWLKNNVTISGSTGATYTTTTLNNNDVISAILTSNATCVSSSTANSNTISMIVNPDPTFSSTISGPVSVTSSQTNVTYSVPLQQGMTYTWSVPPGATIISGAGTNSIVVDFGTSSGTVTLVQTNPLNQSTTISTNVTVASVTTGITLASGVPSEVLLYPVPCQDLVTIELQNQKNILISYFIVDMTGNTVKTGAIQYGETPVQLSTDFAPGMYQVILNWDSKTSMVRVTKY